MPSALSIEKRREIAERRARGEKFTQIAEELGIGYGTTRKIWKRWQEQGTLDPNYAACRHEGIRKKQAIYDKAIEMKRTHPRWGAVVIQLKLKAQFPEDELPAERTLQTWFRQAGVSRSPRVQNESQAVKRGAEVHEVWAIDAKEQMKLQDGSYACWLTITDEASGAIVYTEAFSPEILGENTRP